MTRSGTASGPRRWRAAAEPALAGFLNTVVLGHNSLESALSYLLAAKLESPVLNALTLRDLIEPVFCCNGPVKDAIRADLQAVMQRDPACRGYSTPLLYFKGFHSIQAYRVAHHYWMARREPLALFLQSRISEVFAVDIHPGARLGKGLLFDHATSVVIGETAVIEDDSRCSTRSPSAGPARKTATGIPRSVAAS